MRAKYLLLVAIIALVAIEVSSVKIRKHKKFSKQPIHKTTTTTESYESDVIDLLETDEAAAAAAAKAAAQEESEAEAAAPVKLSAEDPCAKKHCGAGRVCEVSSDGEAECVCIPNCPDETDPRRKVCSNHNETWGSDCEVYQMRCWCDKGSDKCENDKYSHVHIEYYGECRDMPECSSEEMEDFPRRMRDWLFNIMRDLADRDELSDYYLKLEREAETNLTRRWTNAAVWKWCDLDGHPHDRQVSRHELFPIRAPLMALEHCIAPFLNTCDVDDDHKITLVEWGSCLQLDQDDLEDRCEEIRGDDDN